MLGFVSCAYAGAHRLARLHTRSTDRIALRIINVPIRCRWKNIGTFNRPSSCVRSICQGMADSTCVLDVCSGPNAKSRNVRYSAAIG